MIFFLMSLAAPFIFVGLPLILLLLARRAWRGGRRKHSLASSLSALLIVAVGIDAFFIEPRWLEVTETVVESDKVDREWVVVVVADLQTDAPGEYEREVLRRVRELKPDLILFPGDYLQVPEARLEAASSALRALVEEADLQPALGAFAVPGNVEEGQTGWERSFDDTPITTWSDRRSEDLGPLVLTGLPLRASFDSKMVIEPEGKFHIVFGHAPDFSMGEVHADLLIAGHTHGGQVRLPFVGPLITFSQVPRAHAAGHTELARGQHLVVSRGIGMERGPAPRLRFLCRPELAVVRIRPVGSGRAPTHG